MANDCVLKGRILEAFPELTEEHFSSWASDLYVLYSPELEKWLKENYEYYVNVELSYSNVKGNPWYGKRFFDIPFALLDEQIKNRKK